MGHCGAGKVGGGCVDSTACEFTNMARYHSLAPMYYRGAQAAIVVYDITNTDSLERAKNWVKELQRQVNFQVN